MERKEGIRQDNGVISRQPLNAYEKEYANLNSPNRRISRNNENMRAMTSSVYDRGATLLEAVINNDLSKLMDLVKNGCILQVDKEGKSPIHIAAENGYFDILKCLLQAFPMYNVNNPDQYGNTPLHKAANIGNVEMIKVLLERGAQVNVQDLTHGRTPLHEAAWKGFSECVNLLCLVGRLPNLLDYGLFTPLHLAVQNGHNQTTRNLIKCGADILAKNKFGDTPLHTAVRYGHAGVSRIIITVSTNVNQQNQNGDTALHIAAALKRRKIVKLLIEAGAILDVRNYQNESPVDVSVKKNHKEILEIFSIARTASNNPKTVSFTPDAIRSSFPVQSRHVSIPNEISEVVNQTPMKPSRAQSQSPHEKVKSKKSSIVKGIFSRKKKEKVDKSILKPKEDQVALNQPMTPNKSILSCSKRKKSDPWIQNSPQITSIPRVTPVPGLMNTYQPQRGNLYFKDLAGNIKQGPIGFTPMANVPSTCNCSQFTQGGNRKHYNCSQQQSVCMDHGYVDYHGPMHHNNEESNKTKEKSKDKNDQIIFPLTRAKSDESLNQSEHKVRMQEERLKDVKAAQMRSSPVKGRRQNVPNNNWNYRQNSLVKDPYKEQTPQKMSIQIVQKARELKEASTPNERSSEIMRTVMRPSPDGQTDSLMTPNYEQQKFKVDWRAGKYRPDKVILPSSKV